jgi:hypothetical protein
VMAAAGLAGRHLKSRNASLQSHRDANPLSQSARPRRGVTCPAKKIL